MFPAKSEEILIFVSSAEPHIFWRAEKIWNLEFELPPFALALLSLFFLARSMTIDGHRNPIALPSITQIFFIDCEVNA